MTTSVINPVSAKTDARAIALAILFAGFGLVFLTGFAPSTTLHNAAHDSRHAMSFPCH